MKSKLKQFEIEIKHTVIGWQTVMASDRIKARRKALQAVENDGGSALCWATVKNKIIKIQES